MITRRKALALVSSIVGASLLSSCISGDTGDDEPAGQASPGDGGGSDEPITLLLPSGAFERTTMPMLEDFTAETGIEVEPIAMPAEDARSRQILDLTNGTGELDLVLLDGMTWLTQVSEHLVPLGDPEADTDADYLQPLVDMFTIDGDRFASPLGVSIRPLIYRSDLFDAAGLEPPTTPEAMYDAAKALTDGDTYGFVGPYGRATSHVSVWTALAYNFGLENVLDENNEKAAFNTDAGIEALDLMARLYADGLMPVDSIEMQHDGVLVAMQEGRAAMTVLPTSFFLSLNDPEESPHAGNFKIASMPTGPGVDTPQSLATGWGFALSEYSDNADNARALLTYLDERTIDPAPEAEIDQLVRPVSEPGFQHEGTLSIFPDGQIDLLHDSLLNARTLPETPMWDEIQNAMGEEFQRAYLGEIPAEEAIANSEERVNTILAES
ncbi:ABC transporter substrate-binding protein [Jiangella asiatica]|uniref:Extracellular solute-binding protein n=1 Tax=Jiangella asiatica TaxID=2530372 RepID=A0A4R5CLB4_9ACTN|nr:extracellular solute-binding protein [Jiangella asiatica]TDE01139.1 extracellular solute-binding protein [Jiangella asiatica]